MIVKYIKLSAVFAILVLGVLFFVGPRPAMASPNFGPDPADFTQSNRYGNSYPGVPRFTDYVVSSDGYTDILTTHIKIYLPASTGTIHIRDQNICYRTPRVPLVRNFDVGSVVGSGNAARFRIYSPTGGSNITQYGRWDAAANCYTKSLTYNVTGAALDPTTGMYSYDLIATALPGGRYINGFHVDVPAGGYVSQDDTLAASSFGMTQTYPIPPGNNPDVVDQPDPYKNYSNWTLRFGPDCSVTTSFINKYIEIYDDDNFGNPDVQPRPFFIKLEEYNRAGTFRRNVLPTRIVFPDGFGSWVNAGGGSYRVYTTASKKRIRVYYDFNRDMVYRWQIDSAFYDNTLQFQLPFENIFYYRECQLPEATLKAGMTSTPAQMSQDDTVTFTPSITVSRFRAAMTATCAIRRTEYPPTGPPRDLGPQPCVDTTGNPNIPIARNIVLALRPNRYNSPATVVPGSRICDVITITSPTEDKYFARPADRTDSACVTIAKAPYVDFMGNDVWAGGGFVDVSPTCNAGSKIQTVAHVLPSGGVAGSVTEYGGFALGHIIDFGSASKALPDPAGPNGKLLTFSNKDSSNLGYFGAPRHCINDYIAKYSTIAPTGEPNPINVGTRPTGTWHIVGNRNFSAATMPVGSQQIYYIEGNVTITGDIKYPTNYNGPAEIPSLVIIATGNITVQSAVGQMDGMFVTKQSFTTCDPPGGPLSVLICNRQLVVNGPVVAQRLTLLRTFGADGPDDNSKKRPAELFNFNAELYLHNALVGDQHSTVRTTSEQDLPPRY